MIFQIILTVIGAFLSVALTRILIQNGRWIRQMDERMREEHKLMREEHKLMREEHKEIVKTLKSLVGKVS